MADIANVTGTLDDKELNFQHSIGTVYKASASIDGSEKDHVAVLTATDSAGNSYFYLWFLDHSKNRLVRLHRR